MLVLTRKSQESVVAGRPDGIEPMLTVELSMIGILSCLGFGLIAGSDTAWQMAAPGLSQTDKGLSIDHPRRGR